MVYIIIGLVITTYIQILIAKRGNVILGLIMPILFSTFHAMTEAVVWSSPLLIISFAIFSYYVFVYLIAFLVYKKIHTKKNEQKIIDIKDL